MNVKDLALRLCTESITVIIVAQSHANGLALLDEIVWATGAPRKLFIREYAQNFQRVDFTNGSVLKIINAEDPGALLGQHADIVLIDKTSRVSHDILRALIPLAMPGGKIYRYYGSTMEPLRSEDIDGLFTQHVATVQQFDQKAELEALKSKLVALYQETPNEPYQRKMELLANMVSEVVEEAGKMKDRKPSKIEVARINRKIEGLSEFVKDLPEGFPRRKEVEDLIIIAEDLVRKAAG